LSPRILEEFAKHLNPDKLILSPNGTSFNPRIVNHELQKKFICLGKIEPRKKQYEIYNYLASLDFEIDFFGNVEDPRVKLCMSEDTHAAKCFKGPITRD
jgi:hypothetical protein